jgi:hypothetical protein
MASCKYRTIPAFNVSRDGSFLFLLTGAPIEGRQVYSLVLTLPIPTALRLQMVTASMIRLHTAVQVVVSSHKRLWLDTPVTMARDSAAFENM